MSSEFDEERWGPSHQRMEPPFERRHPFASCFGVVFSFLLLLFFVGFIRSVLELRSGSAISWTIGAVIVLVLGRLLLMLAIGAFTRTPRTPRAPSRPEPLTQVSHEPVVHVSVSPAARVREGLLRVGGSVYLGVREGREWAAADPETAAMILGPPRSGKTTAVMIPALMASSGPALSTSTKPDVMQATMHARAEIGGVWLFDPSGTEPLPAGVRRLSWSPVTAAASWDGALLMARAMTAASRSGVGTTNENHWTERAAALLAPLLYAAQLSGRPIEEVLRWTLRQDLAPALEVLADVDSEIAADVLVGIERTDARERSSIFSATAGVLSAYNSDGARQSAANPNFDPDHFAAGTDTIYITSPEQHQAACAPLIVGLLEQIRHAKYAQARTSHLPAPVMLWLLDELPNIVPIHDLPALVSQAGGQGLQIVAGLQDLSQARTRWGTDVADGFLSLFGVKLILNGISEPRTLEAISTVLGEYDRDVTSLSLGRSDPQEWLAEPTHTDTVSYQTQRQRVLTPGDVAKLPDGRGLLLQGADWELIRLTKWHESEPWMTVAGIDGHSQEQAPVGEETPPSRTVFAARSSFAKANTRKEIAVTDEQLPPWDGGPDRVLPAEANTDYLGFLEALIDSDLPETAGEDIADALKKAAITSLAAGELAWDSENDRGMVILWLPFSKHQLMWEPTTEHVEIGLIDRWGATEQAIGALSVGFPTRPVELGFIVNEQVTVLPWFEFCRHYDLPPQYVLAAWG